MDEGRDISILIPWRSDRTTERERNFEWCRARWRAALPKAEICIADSGAPRFNRSASRNTTFAISHGSVLVIADADTSFVDPGHVRAAVRQVASGQRRWCLPFTEYYVTTHESAAHICDLPPDTDLTANEGILVDIEQHSEARIDTGLSGIVVVHRSAYEAVNGYDEGFEGWGWEDTFFARSLSRRWGPLLRIPGAVFHLWHPTHAEKVSRPDAVRNKAHYDRLTSMPEESGRGDRPD